MKKPRMLVVRCPRCNGDGEEPAVPWDPEAGKPLCSLCRGAGVVGSRVRDRYERENPDPE